MGIAAKCHFRLKSDKVSYSVGSSFEASIQKSENMGQMAIFGGTFDPLHWGHLIVAETAWSQLNLDQVIWIPTRHPPHKRGLAYEHRRLMVEQAIANYPAFVLSPLETASCATDYAITTLKNLQDVYPDHHWYWIIGRDAFQTLPRWYCREKLIPACDWLVAPRPLAVATTTNSPQEGIETPLNCCQQVVRQLARQNITIRWQMLQMPEVSISSSLIRQYCRSGRSIRDLVPEAVRTYITTHNLYASRDQ